MKRNTQLQFYGGTLGTLLPFGVFLTGVVWLSISGISDERFFWPFLILSLSLGMALAKNRTIFSEAVIEGMSQPMVIIMILAWLLAGILGEVMQASGFLESMTWLCANAGLHGSAYVIATFLICALVATATGTSLGTILICGPLLYPAGGNLGASPAILMGAVLGGATFGDNISPISDTTIASALTQKADIAKTVRSRLQYAIPAALVALAIYGVLGSNATATITSSPAIGSYKSLVMFSVPMVVLVVLASGRHLLEGLIFGILTAVLVGLSAGLIEPLALLYLDTNKLTGPGLLIKGIERGIGASIFTILLMGLISPLKASGLLENAIANLSRKTETKQLAEGFIASVTTVVVLLTTHPTVAILTVGDFVRQTGEHFGIDRYRRANLMDMAGCGFPFLLPYMLPTILAASMTAHGKDYGMPILSALDIGLLNFHSWALLVMLVITVLTGYGRSIKPSTSRT